MTFEWDENKNRINKKKHEGVSFEIATRVFFDEMTKELRNMTTLIQLLMKNVIRQ